MLRLVINLDRSQDRWEAVSKQFNQYNIPVERISAIDGKTFTEKFHESITIPVDHPMKIGCPGELFPNEVACYLSHIKCWQRLIKSNEQWALIMEDDITLSSRAPKFMLSEDWIPEGIHLLQLHGDRQRIALIRNDSITINPGEKLVRMLRPTPVLAQAYYISREAAAYALDNSQKLAAPVDEYLSSPYYEFSRKYPTWRLNPCVVTATDVPSTIGNRTRKQKSPISVHIRRKLVKLRYKIAFLNSHRENLSFK